MAKRVSKRFLSILLAVLMVVTLVPNVALAANVNTGVTGLTADSSGSATWTASGGTITGSVKAKKSSGCTGDSFTAQNGTLTFTNSSGAVGLLSFDYTLTLSSGTVEVDGTAVNAGASFSKTLEAGETVAVKITSNAADENATTVSISNLKLTAESNVDITFKAPTNGSYTVDGAAITADTVKTVKTTGSVTLAATAASGYKFFGWQNVTSGTYIGMTTPLTTSFTETATIAPVFLKSSVPVFQVGTSMFTDLNEATSYAQSSGIAKIVLVSNGTLPAGNYTIPSGKTLLIPFDEGQTLYTTTPEVVYGSHTNPSAFRTLTMAKNAKITVANGGAISVPSKLSATGTNSGSWNGTPTGKYGCIAMNAGSSIDVQSGGKLYVYGYISGSGNVYARSGSELWEAFQIRCWRGGTATSDMAGNSQKVFPLNQYYVQNIEASTTYYAGAVEKVYTAVNMRSQAFAASATFIGSGGMFNIDSGSATKRFTGATDRLELTVDGNFRITPMSLKITGLPLVGTLDLNTSDYVLPIQSNITINVNSGTTTLSQDVAFLPGAEMTIANGATVTVASGHKAYVYDQDQWGPYAAASLNLVPVGYSTVNGTTAKRTNASLVDVKIDVNGTLKVAGTLYTTESGAAIISSEGTGVYQQDAAAGTETKTYMATQSGSDISYVDIPITAAKLQNADGSYYETAGKPAGTEIPYVVDKWGGEAPADITVKFDANGGTGSMDDVTLHPGDTLTFPDSAFTAPEGKKFVGWTSDLTGDQVFVAGSEFTVPAELPVNEITLKAKWDDLTYTITWKNEDGTVLETDENVVYGTTPAFDGETPAKAETAEYTYTFSGWSPAVTAATADATYTAVYTAEKRSYTITWKHEDGTVINTTTVPYGETPTHADDTKAATDEYTYTFAGWSPAVAAVTGDAEYTATFTSTKNAYTVKFVDEDGTVLQSTQVAYGETPAFNGENPTKASTAQYDYSFSRWTPEITPVTGEATYTATYSATLRRYHVSFVWDNGVVSEADYDYGETVEVPTAPAKDADAQYTYTFAGWQDASGAVVDEIPTVSGDATYTATYTGTIRSYKITFDVEGDKTDFNKEYGTAISSFKPDDPTKTDPNYIKEYTFTGWQLKDSDTMLGENDVVTGEQTYVAVFEESDRVFTYKWFDGIHEDPLYTTTDVANQSPEYMGETPTKDADAQYTYTFADWYRADDLEKGIVTFTARFDQTVNKYKVTFDPANGEEPTVVEVPYGEVPEAPADPQKADTPQYSYEFAGWSPEIAAVTGDATYTAVFTETVNSYIVKWVIDGVETEETYNYGVTPSHPDPVKAADAQYTYTFTGWDPEIQTVTGDATYTARFEKVGKYTVIFKAPEAPDGEALVELSGAETDSGVVLKQPTYPSFLGYTFQGLVVTSGDQMEAINGTNISNEALNDVIARILAASGNPEVTVKASYAKEVETYTVNLKYQMPDGEIVDNFTTEAKAVGEAMKVTTSETFVDGENTYYFDHWVIDGQSYSSLSVTLRPNKAGSYDAVAVYAAGESAKNDPELQVVNAYAETVNGVEKTAVTLSWNVPDGCTVQAVGFRVSTKDATLQNTFSTSTSKLKTADGSYTVHIKAAGKLNTKIYVCAYLTYTDANGASHTILTDPVAYVWNDMNQ